MFTDRRSETITMDYPSGHYVEHIKPDVVADFTDLPFPDNTFALVVMDPPHIQRSGPDGRMTKRYGYMSGEWREMLRKGFAECFRVLRPEGTLIFKWCEVQFPVKEILELSPVPPLFGHQSGKRMNTHWIAFLKPNKMLSVSRELKETHANT
jgi:SAM-dependent methyltransferase